MRFPHGRLLGGTSAINGQAYVANSRSNVDSWGKLGNPGWDWATVQPYYQKSCTLNLPSEEKRLELGLEYIDPTAHAENGPLQISFPDRLQDPVAHAWVETFKKMGLFPSGDPYSGLAVGGFTNPSSINANSKSRSYSANSYYFPIKDRTNLRVVTDALAEKVIFDEPAGGDVVAKGVHYVKDGQPYVVQALREVIISAGVFNSPKILELSGIGSRDLLERQGIQTVIENPNVGENLQDHLFSGVFYEVQDFVKTKDDFMRGDKEGIGAAMVDYQTQKSGTFTVGGNYSGALLPLPDFSHPETGPAELAMVLKMIPSEPNPGYPFSGELATHVKSILQDPAEATGGYFSFLAQADLKSSEGEAQKQMPGNYLTIAVGLMNPLSRGSSHIASADPIIPPTIDPRYLTHPLDLELLARHTRFIETIAASEPLASMLKPGGNRSPDLPGDLRKVPLEKVKEYVKSHCKSTFHPTSTCAMMPREKGGVVDARLRVWGTKNLRIVDASIIPISPRGNTQSTVYAIAERAADLIKEDFCTQ